jgi:hypothetical protein
VILRHAPGLPRRYAPRNDGDTVVVGNGVRRHDGAFRQNHITLARVSQGFSPILPIAVGFNRRSLLAMTGIPLLLAMASGVIAMHEAIRNYVTLS